VNKALRINCLIGDQTSVTTDGTTTDRTANSQNELTGDGSATLTYDNNGNTTTDQTGNTYIYNAWNQIVTVKNSSSTTIATYTYDADGRRTSQDESSVTTDFYLSTQDQVLEERDNSTGYVTAQNIWGLDYVNDLISTPVSTPPARSLTPLAPALAPMWSRSSR
jgi:YD repeat-containing protein